MKILQKMFIGLIVTGISLNAMAAVEVGEVTYSRGVLTGQLEGAGPKMIGKGVGLHNGETLNTGSRGFALIKLKDGTRMTLRPNTTFKIDNVETKKGSENALFSLIRGGFRALTGAISKANANAFRINTSVATIGIRGTEFDARLCAADECATENKATGRVSQNESRVVGRIAVLKGKASATEDDDSSRPLIVGAAVYERDQIQTGIKSFTVIAFNDKTRVTMSPRSAFRIEEHEYKPDQPDENNSFLSFLQGGLRLVTGAIGKLNRTAFRIGTPTATIGIRGTGFDLICEGACVSTNAMRDPAGDTLLGKFLNFFVKPAFALGDGNGMYTKVWSGAIELQLGTKTMLLENGKSAYLKNSFSLPQLIPDLPVNIRSMDGAPRPDKVVVDEGLFSESSPTEIEPGLYVNVRKGDVAVQGGDGKVVNLGAGEASLVGGGKTVRLSFVPAFQKFDKVPDPSKITTKGERLLDLLGEDGGDSEQLECTVR
ncbi:MAG: hypothetical protein ACI9LO_001624 [Planctomycetota bacterium]|jgi:hypothetical protein